MDDLEWIKKGLERPGKTQRGLAIAMGIDPTGVNRMLQGKRDIKANELPKIRAYLESSDTDSPIPGGAKLSLVATTPGRVTSATGEPNLIGPKNLKVLGFVKAGKVGFFLDNGETLEMTERPPMLIGVPDAYAVYVDDRSMFPALKPGHLLWVHPRKPARADDLVIVQLKSGEAFVKEYVKRTDKAIICKQYNPEEEIKFPTDAVIHLVVGIRTSG